MPTYEYECPKCGHRFERFQSITDKPVKTCPKCKGRKVKRLIGTGGAILFKGSGFYATDYRSESFKKEAKKESAPPASESGGGDKKKKKEPKPKSSGS
jgi:putative FmdB family regulatory protein